MGLLFSRPKRAIYLQHSAEPAKIFRNTDLKFNENKGIDIGKMNRRNKIRNPIPPTIPEIKKYGQQVAKPQILNSVVRKHSQKQVEKEQNSKLKLLQKQQNIKAKKQKQKFDRIHQIEEDLKIIVNKIENKLKTLSKEYVNRFYYAIDKKLANDLVGFNRVVKRPEYFWTEIHENSIDETALNNIFQMLKTKLYTSEKKKQEMYKEIILDKIILKPIDSSNNIIPYKNFTEKEKRMFGTDPLRNIYVNYMLFLYLIEKNQINHFVSEEFENKINDRFTIDKNKKLILIKDQNETFFIHKNRFHPKLFDFFSVRKINQQVFLS